MSAPQNPEIVPQTAAPATAAAAPAFVNYSLYVGDLKPDVDEATLFNIFRSMGTVVSVRVLRDYRTHKSLGYAYVNFEKHEDAEKALKKLNYTAIFGRSCRIMWSNRDPSERKTAKGNLFVRNLPKNFNNMKLYELFNQYGAIVTCKANLDAKGDATGIGYVQFEREEDAKKALEEMNGKEVDGRVLMVSDFKSRKDRTGHNLYVKGLPVEMTDEQLKAMFAVVGAVTSVKVKKMYDAEHPNGVSRGYGFVNFEKEEDMKKACELGDKIEKPAGVEFKTPLEVHEYKFYKEDTFTNVFVKNLPESWNEAKFDEVMKGFGEIAVRKDSTFSIAVLVDENGNSRCFGFCNFKRHEDAVKAITELNGKDVDGKQLYAARAMSASERARELAGMVKGDSVKFTPGTNVYIKNLEDDIDEAKLKEIFKACGPIVSTKVMRNNEKVSRGFGFVVFEKPEDAQKAITTMHGTIISRKPLYMALFVPRDIRMQQLAQANALRAQRYYAPYQNYRRGPAAGPAAAPNKRQGKRKPYHQGAQGHTKPRKPQQQQNAQAAQAQQAQQNVQAQQAQQQVQAAQAQAEAAQAAPAPQMGVAPEFSEDEKQNIGENIYSVANEMYNDDELSGKLTGMILDSVQPEELREINTNAELLKKKITEAKEFLDEFSKQQQQ